MTFDELIAEATTQLIQADISTGALDARLLLEYASGMTRTALLLRGKEKVDQALLTRYRDLICKRATRIPLHYLTGIKEFWSLNFHVTPAVLVPRQETEFLLEQVFAVYKESPRPKYALDLCTGSGVIAIVLALELNCPVWATDISKQALEVAATNCCHHKMENFISLYEGDLFVPLVNQQTEKFDLIVSNPPYIAEMDIDTLEPEVARCEPRIALSGGPSGSDILARIANEAPAFLQPGGYLFLEIGAGQREVILSLFNRSEYEDVVVLPDWAGRSRVLRARRTSEAK